MAVTYLMEALTGHPFSDKDVSLLFSAKKIFQRWRSVDGFKQLSQLRKQANNKIPPDLLDTMPSLSRKNQPSITDIVLSIPSYRREIYDAWKLSWEEAACPELVVFNRYCKHHHNIPFYAPNMSCFADKDIDDLKNVIVNDNPYQDLAIILLNECENNTLFDARTIMLDALNTLSLNPDDKLAHDVMWAISTTIENTLAIQYVLHVNPDHIKYYDYLDWRYCDDNDDEALDLNLLHSNIDSEYDANKNIFNAYPKASAILRIESSLSKISQTLLREKIKSTFSTKPLYKRLSLGKQVQDIASLKHQITRVEGFLGSSTRHILIDFINGIKENINKINTLVETTSSTYAGLDLTLVEVDPIDALIIQANNLPNISLNTLLMTESNTIDEHLATFFEEMNELALSLKDNYSKYNELSKNPIENKDKIIEVLGHITNDSELLNKNTKEVSEAYTDLAQQISKRIESKKEDEDDTTTKNNCNTHDSDGEENTKIQTLNEKIDTLNSEIITLNNEQDTLKCELKRAKAKAEAISCQQQTEIADDNSNALTEAFESHITKTITPVDVLNVLDHAFDSLVVLPSALNSASCCNQFKQTAKMYNYIKVLATKYLNDINSHKPDTEARKHFGTKAYAANESQSVTNNPELMKLRTFTYNNQKVIMDQHLVIGIARNTNETMRIYFKVIDAKIVIGYAGHHLPTTIS